MYKYKLKNISKYKKEETPLYTYFTSSTLYELGGVLNKVFKIVGIELAGE